MAKKYYAVKKGRKPGIYFTWDACKEQVMGYSGAIYKSFPTQQEAQRFVQGEEAMQTPVLSEETAPSEADAAIAYVDGSYDHKARAYSCGAILFHQGREITFSKKYMDQEMAEMRNVAGEIMGATEVIGYCLSQHIPSLVIYHDYEGVARWADGSWKANKPGTKAYAKTCQEASQHLKLSFQKVKGHSGDKYNDLADSLAKEALGLK